MVWVLPNTHPEMCWDTWDLSWTGCIMVRELCFSMMEHFWPEPGKTATKQGFQPERRRKPLYRRLCKWRKNRQGILFFKDNSFVKATMWTTKWSGRCLNVWADGTIASDILLRDKRNGPRAINDEAKQKLYEVNGKTNGHRAASLLNFHGF